MYAARGRSGCVNDYNLLFFKPLKYKPVCIYQWKERKPIYRQLLRKCWDCFRLQLSSSVTQFTRNDCYSTGSQVSGNILLTRQSGQGRTKAVVIAADSFIYTYSKAVGFEDPVPCHVGCSWSRISAFCHAETSFALLLRPSTAGIARRLIMEESHYHLCARCQGCHNIINGSLLRPARPSIPTDVWGLKLSLEELVDDNGRIIYPLATSLLL